MDVWMDGRLDLNPALVGSSILPLWALGLPVALCFWPLQDLLLADLLLMLIFHLLSLLPLSGQA